MRALDIDIFDREYRLSTKYRANAFYAVLLLGLSDIVLGQAVPIDGRQPPEKCSAVGGTAIVNVGGEEINLAISGCEIVNWAAGSFSLLATRGPGIESSLDQITGVWTRVGNNNVRNDGMQIEVNGNSGVVFDQANSGYTVGSLKWRGITITSSGYYGYQELGSDGSYYDSSMALVGPNELSITVGKIATGYSQKWVRGEVVTSADGGVPQTKKLSCDLENQVTTLRNTAAPVDYSVDCVVKVTSGLRIEAGVVMEFTGSGGIGVYDNGSISAIGTADLPIVMRASSGSGLRWRGIHIETSAPENRLEYAHIQQAGGEYVYCCNNKATLLLKGGRISLENVRLEQGAGYGLVMTGNAQIEDLHNLTITTHAQNPVFTDVNLLPQLLGEDLDFSGNDSDSVRILSTKINTSVSVPALPIPYVQGGFVLNVNAALEIAAGTTWIMEAGAGIGIYGNGSLTMAGTAARPIEIRGTDETTGTWRGIYSNSDSRKNSFSYATISGAGSNYVYCCDEIASVVLRGGQLAMDHVTLQQGGGYGLLVKEEAELRDYLENTITGHSKEPVFIAANRVGGLDGLGSTYSGNSIDYIAIENVAIDDPVTWRANDVPYLIGGVVDVRQPMTLEPGVDIVFRAGAGLGLYQAANLTAIGSPENEIQFRGFKPLPAYWRGIFLQTGAVENEIDHAVIEHAGSNYVYCCGELAGLNLVAGKLTIKNSSVRNLLGCGIRAAAAATLVTENLVFSNIALGNICDESNSLN